MMLAGASGGREASICAPTTADAAPASRSYWVKDWKRGATQVIWIGGKEPGDMQHAINRFAGFLRGLGNWFPS